ncbi:hypothetical protein WN943_015050 [Citrus x changshan-huyou]
MDSIITAVESADTNSENMNNANTNNKSEGMVVESGADGVVNWQNASIRRRYCRIRYTSSSSRHRILNFKLIEEFIAVTID